jgi:hypothetical protein
MRRRCMRSSAGSLRQADPVVKPSAPSFCASCSGLADHFSLVLDALGGPFSRLLDADPVHQGYDREQRWAQDAQVPVGVHRTQVLWQDLGEPEHAQRGPRQIEQPRPEASRDPRGPERDVDYGSVGPAMAVMMALASPFMGQANTRMDPEDRGEDPGRVQHRAEAGAHHVPGEDPLPGPVPTFSGPDVASSPRAQRSLPQPSIDCRYEAITQAAGGSLGAQISSRDSSRSSSCSTWRMTSLEIPPPLRSPTSAWRWAA